MLLAHELGAQLIVAVGTHNSMEEFLDKGRAGMASTFLVRLRVGASLVDAKGVNRLYRPVVKTRDISVLVDRRAGRPARRHARQRAAAPLAAQPVDLPPLRARLMINIRYHVYSLVAVFLALAIGVAAGSTVVQRSVVDNLRSTQGRIEQNLDELEAQNAELQERTDALEGREGSLIDEGPAALLAGKLTGATARARPDRGHARGSGGPRARRARGGRRGDRGRRRAAGGGERSRGAGRRRLRARDRGGGRRSRPGAGRHRPAAR